MRSALKLGRSTSFFGHQLHHILPEQREEVLAEILALNQLLPAVNVLLPETEKGTVPLLQIWTTDVNFDPTDDVPVDIINFTHFRENAYRSDERAVPQPHPQTIFFCSQNGEDDPISCQYELEVSGVLFLNREHQTDAAFLALHVEDTFTICRFERRNNELELRWARHRTEDGETLQLFGTERSICEDAEERIRQVQKSRLTIPVGRSGSPTEEQ